jgi:hypothetical protein
VTPVSEIVEKLRTGTADAAEQVEISNVLVEISGAYALLLEKGREAEEAGENMNTAYETFIATQARLISALEGQVAALEDRVRMLERELEAPDDSDREISR